MSPQALQRMVVRMLFDPALVAQVYGSEPVQGLDEAARAMLTQPDRRAWGTDPYRRTRALTALLEEFPASAAQAGVANLDAFFSSAAFHQVCEERGSMALGFGVWVEAHAGPVARLETALAQVRRPQPTGGGGISLSPMAVVVQVPAGTLDQYQALRAQLGPNPVVTLAEGGAKPVAAPHSTQVHHLLVQGSQGGDISLTHASETLASLLMAAAAPVERQELEDTAQALGATAQEAGEIIDDLLGEGVLVEA